MGGEITANAELSIPPATHTLTPTHPHPNPPPTSFLLIISFFKCKAAKESELISLLVCCLRGVRNAGNEGRSTSENIRRRRTKEKNEVTFSFCEAFEVGA